MLRKFEFLVNEVRDTTDTQDINSINIYEIMRYFNDAQKNLQKIIYSANPSADIFVSQASYSLERNKVAYDLPFNIYAHNSVSSVSSLKDSKIANTLTRVAYREKEILRGYSLLDKQIVLTSSPEISSISELLVNYVYKIPTLSPRLAKVASIDLVTNTIAIDPASVIDDDKFQERYDKYSVVDSRGTQKARQLHLVDFNGTSFEFEGNLEADSQYGLSGVEVGDWIVCGDNATSHSLLPESCEPYLLSYVQRRILSKLSSVDTQVEVLFSESERADIEDLFKDNVKDPIYPVITDSFFLGY